MKFRFKVQPFQTEAVEAVADCFQGQPLDAGLRYRIDPGAVKPGQTARLEMDEGFRNADIALPLAALLKNIQAIQLRQNLPETRYLEPSIFPFAWATAKVKPLPALGPHSSRKGPTPWTIY